MFQKPGTSPETQLQDSRGWGMGSWQQYESRESRGWNNDYMPVSYVKAINKGYSLGG